MNASSTEGSHQKTGPYRRHGVHAVEFAVVAPVLFTLIFGIIEFTRVLMVQHTLADAARDAAREASLPSMRNTSTVESNCRSRLSASIPAAKSGNAVSFTLTPGDLSTASSGDTVRVRVGVNYSEVSWVPSFAFKSVRDNTTLAAEATLERE